MGRRKCKTKYCRNDARPGGTECPKCASRRYAREHPFRYHYNALKQNAKRRGKPFDLSFAEFKQIWLEHPEKWAEKKRWGHECPWQMDRKDNTKGYTASNIEIISKSKNVIKYHRSDRFHMEVYWAERNGQQRLGLGEEAPF